jgi:Tfp pilus assembly PilM family ATPase
MVRSVGIDPGDHSVKVVELDGNYRKTRLMRVHTENLVDGGSRPEAVALAARVGIDLGMRGEAFLGHPCREAVLRVIELPFKGHDAIRKVVKSEIEGEIHSHAVDDMVVDFHEIGPGADGSTRVLVASVPKDSLRQQLAALTAQSIEPETVDLDTMALWRVAHWAGAFEGGGEGSVVGGVTAVVDLGTRSVKVVLVEGDTLVEMRALRLGDAAISEDIARRNGVGLSVARDAVRECLTSGGDCRVEVDEALPATGSGDNTGAEAAPKQRVVTITHQEVDAAQTAFLQRLARELVRYLTSSGKASQIKALWITGGAIRVPGMREMLQEVFSIEPRELDVLGRLQHDLDPETAADLAPRIATAVGLALTPFGGPTGFDLRQEDLAYTRGFERIKFPLAIACMVGLLALFVFGNQLSTQLKHLELEIGKTYQDKDPKVPLQFHGMLYSVFSTKWFEIPQNFRLEQSKGKDYGYKDLIADLDGMPVQKRVLFVRDKLAKIAEQKQKESGIYEDVSLESGLAVLVRFAQVLNGIEPQLGRYLMMRLDLNMKAPNRSLEFVVAFRGDDFREKAAVLEQAFDAECEKGDSPFAKSTGRDSKSKEDLFKPDPSVRGAYYTIKIGVKPVFEPFGPSK